MRISRRFSIVERNDIVQKSQQCLWSVGKVGLAYLTEKRKLSKETIRSFGLGYIPPGINHQLRGRIIMPVYDPSHNLVAVSSRRVNEDDTLLPVYWHESYEKTFYLYGITQAHAGLQRWRFALVCEGQFDVMQLHNHGIDNVVGLSGTKMSDVHLAVIYRSCEDIILLLDSDSESKRAGQSGAEKIMDRAKQSYADSRSMIGPGVSSLGVTNIQQYDRIDVVTLPGETDPDEFVQNHGAEALKSIVRNKLHKMRERYGVH